MFMTFMLNKKEGKIITGILNIFTCNYVCISVFREIQNWSKWDTAKCVSFWFSLIAFLYWWKRVEAASVKGEVRIVVNHVCMKKLKLAEKI